MLDVSIDNQKHSNFLNHHLLRSIKSRWAKLLVLELIEKSEQMFQILKEDEENIYVLSPFDLLA
jgi:hypothetical protein